MTDKQQKEAGKEVVVGIGAIGKPTPMILKYIFRGFSFLSGAWALFAPALTDINEETLGDIDRWLLVGVTFMHYAIKFFGWDYKDE